MTFRRRLYVWWFLVRRIPLIPFLGIRVTKEAENQCQVVIDRLWRNRNPFGITYFGALIAAGEMAGGMLLIQKVLDAQEYGVNTKVLIRRADASFKRPATGPITFNCEDGEAIRAAMHAAVSNPRKPVGIKLRSTGYNEAGKIACTVDIEWLVVAN